MKRIHSYKTPGTLPAEKRDDDNNWIFHYREPNIPLLGMHILFDTVEKNRVDSSVPVVFLDIYKTVMAFGKFFRKFGFF